MTGNPEHFRVLRNIGLFEVIAKAGATSEVRYDKTVDPSRSLKIRGPIYLATGHFRRTNKASLGNEGREGIDVSYRGYNHCA